MSTTADEQMTDERAERPVVVREFAASDMAIEGRTVDVRIVPFGEVARVADPPDFKPYQEEWLPGVFDHQLNAASRVHAKYGHSESVLDVVGHGVGGTLRSDSGGYYISTKMHQTPQGDTALELLRDGALPCVSLEAVAPSKWSSRTPTGVVQRRRANLHGFAFCRQGAFAGARVLAIREELAEDFTFDEKLLPPPPPKELLERCEKLGINLPEGMATLLTRAFTEIAWDGSPSRWATAEAYCAASAIDKNAPGKTKTKMLCHLPYKEPGSGDVNINAVRNALGQLEKITAPDVTQADKDKARALLERLLASYKSQS